MCSLLRGLQASPFRSLSSPSLHYPASRFLRTYLSYRTMSMGEEHPAKKQKMEAKVCAALEHRAYLNSMASSVILSGR